MPRVAIPIRDITTLGTRINVGSIVSDQANGHYIEGGAGDRVVLLCLQASGTAGTVTPKFGKHPITGSSTVDRVTTLTVGAWCAIGPFPAQWYDQVGNGSPGQVWIDVTATTNFNLVAVRIPGR